MAVPVEAGPDHLVPGDELPFAVAHGEVEVRESLGEDARRGGIDGQMDPAVFEAPRVVVTQCGRLGLVIAVEAGEEPQLHEELEAVADPEDELAVPDEAGHLIVEFLLRAGDGGVADPVGPGLGGAEVVAVEKAAGKVEEIIVVEELFPGEEFADVDDVHDVGAGKTAGVGHFHLAVRAVARDYDALDDLAHSVPFNPWTNSLLTAAIAARPPPFTFSFSR